MRGLGRSGVFLTPEQRRAVLHESGPMLVFAGPGSGKTTLITVRALCLTRVYEVPAEKLTLVTFTRKSAQELRQRLIKLDATLSRCQVGTFHSLFLHWLMAFRPGSIRIMSAGQQHVMMREAWAHVSGVTRESRVLAASRYYEEQKRRRGVWDYDDILSEFHKLIQDNHEVLSEIQQRTPFWMVDEFQDTNPIQWLSIILLCKQSGNLTVVGDDDQAIYGFRGATPQIMLSFATAFPDVQEVILSHNFRSTDPIVSAANALISHNQDRRPKNVETVRGDGGAVCLSRFADELQEAQSVVRLLDERRQKAPDHWTAAVLARTHAQLYVLLEMLTQRQIPFAVWNDSRSVWQDTVAKRLLKVLALATRLDHACAQSEWRELVAFLGLPYAMSLDDPASRSCSLRVRLSRIAARSAYSDRVLSFSKALTDLCQMTPQAALDRLQLEEAQLLGSPSSASISDEMQAVYAALRLSTNGFNSLSEWLAYAQRRTLKRQDANRPFLSVLTLHGAKGLEFDDVFVIGLHADACPHPRSLSQLTDTDAIEALAQERRLLYVGMTRARNRLDLTYPATVHGRSRKLSPFVQEIESKRDLIVDAQYAGVERRLVGELCEHRDWGKAVISSAQIVRDGLTQVCLSYPGQRPRYLYWEVAVRAGVVRLL
ncbi:MAG: ATP-dependent helicase [Firmicutes bacterium]|nr:ATP-dependent helicase [Bacillota bacterium]